jgi:hypothetical protein
MRAAATVSGQDVVAVRKSVPTPGAEARAVKGCLQTLVLDHAGEDV